MKFRFWHQGIRRKLTSNFSDYRSEILGQKYVSFKEKGVLLTLQKRYFFEKIIKSMNGIIGMYAQVLKSTTSHGQVEGNKNVL